MSGLNREPWTDSGRSEDPLTLNRPILHMAFHQLMAPAWVLNWIEAPGASDDKPIRKPETMWFGHMRGDHMEAYEIVLQAISERRLLTCVYEERPRTLVPLVVYRNESGQVMLHCWQTHGTTYSGRPVPCWSDLEIEWLFEVVMTFEQFRHTPEGYYPELIKDVIVQVPKNPIGDNQQ